MNLFRLSLVPLLACTAFLLPTSLSAQIVNIDFLGIRTDDATKPESTPHGAGGDPSGFAGGGTVYNDIAADDTADTDNLTVGALNLVDSHGTGTLTNFTISPVGADNGGIGVFNGSYLFTNSANNHALTVPFTIGGLGTATHLDIIFFTTNNFTNIPVVTFNGSTTAATVSANPDSYTFEYDNIAVVGGQVVGTIGDSNTSDPLILSGLAFEAVPEPSAWAMMGLGAVILVYRLRRRVAV